MQSYYDNQKRICQVIKEHTIKETEEQQQTTIEYFEALRLAYQKTLHFTEYFGEDIGQDDINKNFKGL